MQYSNKLCKPEGCNGVNPTIMICLVCSHAHHNTHTEKTHAYCVYYMPIYTLVCFNSGIYIHNNLTSNQHPFREQE